ncbi:heme biosynthesis protein HemY [Lichenibacterium dinghuense]|uniref:heme biosynthesis protein HemY n=1 Tax=Lichenibacterium dinghuense TaxID=2895977 RepID=UPI001F43815C|nr:heme biosynthesis HemY N-terminal domain-containing protein [Lichenibacterium sp. 6Y81]
MIRVLIYFAVVVLLAMGVVWLADHPGMVMVTFGGREVQTSTLVGAIALLAAAAAVVVLWTILLALLRAWPAFRGWRGSQRRRKGLAALSRGLVAVGTGDQVVAQRCAVEAELALDREPLVMLLKAQAAQMAGDTAAAEKTFAAMLNAPETRALGLRGLHIEAQRRSDPEAAYAYAEEALKTATLPWAGDAVLEHRAARGDWDGALSAVDRNLGGRLIDRATANRQRAVLNTAKATEMADHNPLEALMLAREALKVAPTLVPAAALAAKLLTRQGDTRRATKLIETAYAATPHPDLADAYLNVRSGDSGADRLARAETLSRLRPGDPESAMALAHAALDARDFGRARDAMRPLVDGAAGARPTVRACRLMAEIEEAEHGDTGALFEWLQRAQRAPRDPAWIADGVVSDRWSPCSPVTGRLDAFEWATPQEQISAGDEVEHLRDRPAPADAPLLVEKAQPADEARPAEAEAAAAEDVPAH